MKRVHPNGYITYGMRRMLPNGRMLKGVLRISPEQMERGRDYIAGLLRRLRRDINEAVNGTPRR